MTTAVYDYAIVGAGMAGASIAAELAPYGEVILLEAEERPGYHATGRSAAFWEECYGGPEIVPLTLASGPYLKSHGILRQRGAIYIGRSQDAPEIDAFLDRFARSGATIGRLNAAQLAQKVPRLRSEWNDAIHEPACADIDVAGLHQHYLQAFSQAGGTTKTSAALTQAVWKQGQWHIAAGSDNFTAKTLVNAAGAWADEVALLSGVRPIGIAPKRRTVVQLRVSPLAAPDLPLVLDINGTFYFKPENGRLWLSPHDEVASEPCDAAPEELAVAQAIDRLEQVTDWKVEAVERKWAGLRSFAPDRLPVYGRDSDLPSFFWFAGQGGSGIQTAPAAARLASQMLLCRPTDAMTKGLNPEIYSPARFG